MKQNNYETKPFPYKVAKEILISWVSGLYDFDDVLHDLLPSDQYDRLTDGERYRIYDSIELLKSNLLKYVIESGFE